jgi:hypothetical protein
MDWKLESTVSGIDRNHLQEKHFPGNDMIFTTWPKQDFNRDTGFYATTY